MTPTALNLFFVQRMLSPEDPRGWERLKDREYSARQRAKSPEKANAATRAWQQENLEGANLARRKWDQENSERKLETTLAWKQKNPDQVRANKREYRTKRRAHDCEYRLLHTLRSRILRALKKNTKGAGSRELLGCTIRELKSHLEKQFRPGMTWENQGPVWHIDHIRPCASFDLRDIAQQRECFNWSNCQPLFAAENLRKGKNFSN